jgi:hypothetical protein
MNLGVERSIDVLLVFSQTDQEYLDPSANVNRVRRLSLTFKSWMLNLLVSSLHCSYRCSK